MARKTVRQNEKEVADIAFYKWQFLRRNKNYRSEYDEYWMFKKSSQNRKLDLSKFEDEQERKFSDRWWIDRPTDYSKEKPRPFPVITDRLQPCPVVLVNNPNDLVTGRETARFTLPKGDVLVPLSVHMRIDLSAPRGRVLCEFEKLLDSLRKKREALLKEACHKEQIVAPHIDAYEALLKAWDFVEKNKERMTLKKMAKLLYAKREEAGDFLRKRHMICQRYIDGGYKKM